MDFHHACQILNLYPSFSLKELNHNYRMEALKYHPDKNKDKNSNEKFLEIQEAYQYLQIYDTRQQFCFGKSIYYWYSIYYIICCEHKMCHIRRCTCINKAYYGIIP